MEPCSARLTGRHLWPALALLLIAALVLAASARAATATKVADTPVQGDLTNSGGTLFFVGFDPTHGTELWTSDGTAMGTELVKDIRPGTAWSSPTLPTDVGGTLYFVANDGTRGRELWRSDGTAAGTKLVRDIVPGPTGSSPERAHKRRRHALLYSPSPRPRLRALEVRRHRRGDEARPGNQPRQR